MVSASDLLPTPSEFATPEQIKASQDMYSTWLKNATTPHPMIHKLSGPAAMAQALMGTAGQIMMGKLQRDELKKVNPLDYITQGGEPGGAPGGPPGTNGAKPMSYAPGSNIIGSEASNGLKFNTSAAGQPRFKGFIDELIAAGAPINDIGSYNNRNIAGTNIKSQHAFGNAIDLNQTGRNQVSPEFLQWAQHNAGKLQELEAKYGLKSGGGWRNPDFGHWELDPAFKGGGGGPMSFNGEPVDQPGSPQLAANALAAPGSGSTFPMPKSVPMVPGGGENGQLIPPGVINMRPQVNTAGFRNALNSPFGNQAYKDMAMQLWLEQNQPVQMEAPFGKVLIGRNGQQFYIPTPQKNDTEVNGIKPGGFRLYDPKTQTFKNVPVQGGSMPSPNPPPTSPPPTPLEDIPYAPKEPGAAEGQGLPDVITKGPEAAKEQNMLNYSPEDLGVPVPKAGTAGKSAQITPEIENLANYGLQLKQREEAGKKEADSFAKKYDTLTEAGQSGASAIPTLQLARRLTTDPKFYSGIFHDGVLDWKRFKDATGIEPGAASVMESFQKLMSSQLLKSMRTELHGLGQVRVAELEILQNAAANGRLSPAANRFVIDLTIKALQKAQAIGEITARYSQGYRHTWNPDAVRPDGGKGAFQVNKDANGRQIREAGPHTLAGLDAHINDYLKHSPLFSPEEEQQMQDMLANKTGYGGPPEKKSPYAKERPEPKLKPAEKQAPKTGGHDTLPPGYE